MVPSSLLTYVTARWVHENREKPLVVAFKQGLSPIVVSTILATSWILTAANDDPARDWTVWLTTAVTVLLIWRTRIHILWLLGVGAVLGGLGYI
jgi:chromate transporter